MARILLTSVFKPFGSNQRYSEDNLNGQHSLPEFFHGQATFMQDIFTIRGEWLVYGLDLIGLNISHPTTVLHYPSKREFVNEMKSGDYDYIGINSVLATSEKAKIMAGLARKYSPKSKIIFGGYLAQVSGAGQYADLICEEDGVLFFRSLLGEHPCKPEVFKLPMHKRTLSLLGFTLSSGAVLINSVGCTKGCDFCATSSKFKNKVIYFTEKGKKVYEYLKQVRDATGVANITITDENFLLNKEQVDELARNIREDIAKNPCAKQKPFMLTVFGSLDAIKQYSPEELVKAGISTIWVGEESLSSNYAKNSDKDFKEVLGSLTNVGISSLCSFLIGLDHHDKRNIMSDFEYHLSLEPAMSQFIIYGPLPGTPLWKRLESEGRIMNVPAIRFDGFSLVYRHENFSVEEIEELQDRFFEEDYEKLGPSVYRVVKVMFMGYQRLKDSTDEVLRAYANAYSSGCSKARILMKSFIAFAPTKKLKGEIRSFSDALKDEFGKLSFMDFLLSNIVLISAFFHKYLIPEKKRFNPRLVKRIYNQ